MTWLPSCLQLLIGISGYKNPNDLFINEYLCACMCARSAQAGMQADSYPGATAQRGVAGPRNSDVGIRLRGRPTVAI